MAVPMKVSVFWNLAPWTLIYKWQYFGWTLYLEDGSRLCDFRSQKIKRMTRALKSVRISSRSYRLWKSVFWFLTFQRNVVFKTPLCHTYRSPKSTHMYRQSLKYCRWISAGSWIRFAHPIARHLGLFARRQPRLMSRRYLSLIQPSKEQNRQVALARHFGAMGYGDATRAEY